jgi:hypothetical protein
VDDDASNRREQPYVAHYAWPPEPRVASDRQRLAAEERQLARDSYLARWRGLFYALGVVLVCVSIAGGAFAVMAVAGALAAPTGGTTTLVLGVTPGGGQSSITLTATQAIAVAVAMVVLEALTICAAWLLFAKRLHGRFWLVVTLAALLASGAAVWAWETGRHDLLSLYSPMVYVCPVVVIAGLVQLLRAHRLRMRWGEPDA